MRRWHRFAIPLGVVAALHRGSFLDRAAGVLPVLFASVASDQLLLGHALVTQAQVRSTALLLQLTTQLQFELAQWFNYICFEQRSRCRVAFHPAVRESL